jgi:hypothetical protein
MPDETVEEITDPVSRPDAVLHPKKVVADPAARLDFDRCFQRFDASARERYISDRKPVNG